MKTGLHWYSIVRSPICKAWKINRLFFFSFSIVEYTIASCSFIGRQWVYWFSIAPFPWLLFLGPVFCTFLIFLLHQLILHDLLILKSWTDINWISGISVIACFKTANVSEAGPSENLAPSILPTLKAMHLFPNYNLLIQAHPDGGSYTRSCD